MRSLRIIRFGFACLPRIIAVRSYNMTSRAIQALRGGKCMSKRLFRNAIFDRSKSSQRKSTHMCSRCAHQTYIFVIEKALASSASRRHVEAFKAAVAAMCRSVATLVYHRPNCTRFDREILSPSDGPTGNSNSFSTLRNQQTPARTPQNTPFMGGKKRPGLIDGRAESVWGSEAAKHRASVRRQREGCRRLFAAKISPQIQIANDHVGQIWCRVFLLCVIA
ncbi:hypothetical protein ACVMB0_007515 [Bradyrhizobium sp. USDA 4451]